VEWLNAVDENFVRFLKYGQFEPVEKSKVNPACTVMTSTWAVKKKASEKFRARLNTRGYE